jgi:hypothetical protein
MSKFDANVVAMLTRHRAVGYFHAALDIVPRNSALEPKYFMFSHAIELALKAYLMVNGHSVDFCRRKLNHDLKKAMKLAQSHELGLSEHHQAIIASLPEQHSRPFSFRYFNPDGWSAPSFLNVERCCRRLLLNAQGPIFRANGLTLQKPLSPTPRISLRKTTESSE